VKEIIGRIDSLDQMMKDLLLFASDGRTVGREGAGTEPAIPGRNQNSRKELQIGASATAAR
jgi:hypothetical protein